MLIATSSVASEFKQVADDSSAVRVPESVGEDRWFGADKAKHFVLSGLVTGLTYFAVDDIADQSDKNATMWGGSIALATGIGKEIYDMKSPSGHPSLKDLVADILGIGVALFIMRSL